MAVWGKKKKSEFIPILPLPECGFVDLHCHCLPGVDDGPASWEEALALARALVADGVRHVTTTTHQLGQFGTELTADELRQAVSKHQARLRDEGVEISVYPGAEVHVDEQLLTHIKNDVVLTVADGKRYLLLEMPFDIFFDIRTFIADLNAQGLHVLLAHPERNRTIMREPRRLWDWVAGEITLQITASSLAGVLGSGVQKTAWVLLDGPLSVIAASDAHDAELRGPRMHQAYSHVAYHRGLLRAREVFWEIPHNILKQSGAIKV